ncbi:general secretion pathway protein GspE [Myxococcaceae bacterium GXIMD 01537]
MRKRLGDILLARGAVDGMQLQAALAFQRQWGVPLGQVVVDQRFCTAEQVLGALAEQSGVPAVDLDAEALEPALAPLLSVKVAEAHRVVPLRVEGLRESVLVVAIAAPASLASLDAVKSVSGKSRVVARLATDAAIQRAISHLYRGEARDAAGATVSLSLPESEEAEPLTLTVHSMAEDLMGDGRFGAAREEPPAPPPARVYESVELPGFEPLELPPPPPASVLIYGWGAAASSGLERVLGGAGIVGRVATTDEVLAAGEGAVVLAPLPSLEALRQPTRAQLLVAGKAPERDLPRAQALGARGFLEAPLDADLMLRAVRRLLRTPAEALRRAS